MTRTTTAFNAPISTSRPRGARRIDVYGPKINRRVQCFSEAAYRQWVALEADPSVLMYCERPAFLQLGDDRILVDYWVKQDDCESLLIIGDGDTLSTAAIDDTSYSIKSISHVDLMAAQTWLENWERILPIITSCHSLISDSLLKSIQRLVSSPMPLLEIEKEMSPAEPTLVRAAVFTLLHRGRLRAPQLKTEELSFLTQFERQGGSHGSPPFQLS